MPRTERRHKFEKKKISKATRIGEIISAVIHNKSSAESQGCEILPGLLVKNDWKYIEHQFELRVPHNVMGCDWALPLAILLEDFGPKEQWAAG